MDDEKFTTWVDELVKHCLPKDLQMKILLRKPLTKQELERFVGVVNLVAQAKGLRDHADMASKLDNLATAMRKSHANERDILFYVSGQKEKYRHKDGRNINDVKSAAVYLACTRINKNPLEDERAIALKIFNDYSKAKGFYDDFDSFMKQIKRVLPAFQEEFRT